MLISREKLIEHISEQKKKLDMLIYTLNKKFPTNLCDQINIVRAKSAFNEFDILEKYINQMSSESPQEEKPKEKGRVWTCVNCKRNIWFDNEKGFYLHCDSGCYSCNDDATISTNAIPKPDSERWLQWIN